MATAPQTINFEWEDETLLLRPSHDLYMQIEERVSFGRLANIFAAASINGSADVPMSHVSWVLFCVLRQSGKPVGSPIEVHQVLMATKTAWGPLLSALIAAYYGAIPAKAPTKNAKKAAPTRPRSRR